MRIDRFSSAPLAVIASMSVELSLCGLLLGFAQLFLSFAPSVL
jgi:hypothetical protein